MRVATVLAILVAAGCATPPTDAPQRDDFPLWPERTDAPSIAAGRAQALDDIANGDPHLVTFGLMSPDFSPLDPESGLPRESLGCVVTPEGASFMKGYNDATIEAVAAGRVATYKDRATTRAALYARFGKPDVVSLTPEHPSVDVPGGKLRIEVGPYQYSFDPPGKTTPYLFVVDVSSGKRRGLEYLRGLSAKVAFDANARTLLLRDDGYDSYCTYDLATRRLLQRFGDPATSHAE